MWAHPRGFRMGTFLVPRAAALTPVRQVAVPPFPPLVPHGRPRGRVISGSASEAAVGAFRPRLGLDLQPRFGSQRGPGRPMTIDRQAHQDRQALGEDPHQPPLRPARTPPRGTGGAGHPAAPRTKPPAITPRRRDAGMEASGWGPSPSSRLVPDPIHDHSQIRQINLDQVALHRSRSPKIDCGHSFVGQIGRSMEDIARSDPQSISRTSRLSPSVLLFTMTPNPPSPQNTLNPKKLHNPLEPLRPRC